MQWVVDEKLRKGDGWTLGGLGKKMGGLAGENGPLVVFIGKEVVRGEEA